MLKLIPKLQTNKPFKLLLVDMKAYSSILMARMVQNKQKCLIFIVIPRVRVENQIS